MERGYRGGYQKYFSSICNLLHGGPEPRYSFLAQVKTQKDDSITVVKINSCW